MINPNAKRDLDTIDRIIGEIKRSQITPNWKPQTSMEMRQRANRIREHANTAMSQGVAVYSEYQYIDQEED